MQQTDPKQPITIDRESILWQSDHAGLQIYVVVTEDLEYPAYPVVVIEALHDLAATVAQHHISKLDGGMA